LRDRSVIVMAKKRLNRKLIVILLLTGLPILMVLGIAVDSRRPWLPESVHRLLGRDPLRLRVEAQELVKQAEEAENEILAERAKIEDPKEAYELYQELREKRVIPLWKDVFRTLGDAIRYSRKNRDLRKELLNLQANLLVQIKQYSNAVGVWNLLFQEDATDYEAKRKSVDFLYEGAQNSRNNSEWSSVQTEADVLIKLRPDDAYGYVLKAHADIALATMGATEDAAKLKEEAGQLLSQALGFDDKNVMALRLQADLASLEKRDIDDQEKKSQLDKQAEDYLRQAIAKNPDDPQAYINLFEHFMFVSAQEASAQTSAAHADLSVVKAGVAVLESQIEELEKQLSSVSDELDKQTIEGEIARNRLGLKNLQAGIVERRTKAEEAQKRSETLLADKKKEVSGWMERFPDRGEFCVFMAYLNLLGADETKGADEAIQWYEKALACKDAELGWYGSLARLYIRRGGYTSSSGKEDTLAAYNLLRKSLYLPDSIQPAGPKKNPVLQARFGEIIPLLIDICANLAQDTDDQKEKDKYLATAQDVYKGLEEMTGKDDSYTKAAYGTIALACGNRDEGLKNLYEADQQLEISGSSHAFMANLKWKLFGALSETEYKTLAREYAIGSWHLAPRSERDYVRYLENLLDVRGMANKRLLLRELRIHEDKYGKDSPYRQQILLMRAKALVRLNRWAEARDVLAKLQGDDKELQILRAQSHDDMEKRVEALQEVAKVYPDDTALVNSLVEYYVQKARENKSYYEQALKLVELALKTKPDEIGLLEWQKILSEPDPNAVTPERKQEIDIEVIGAIKDTFEKNRRLAEYYLGLAASQQKQGPAEQVNENLSKARELCGLAMKEKPEDADIISIMFNIMLAQKDWPAARDLIAVAEKRDSLSALMMEADLEISQEQWTNAVTKLESFLQRRPISVRGHLALSQAYMRLERSKDALEQARIAVSQDSGDIMANMYLAQLLHRRNVQIGQHNLTVDQANDVLERIGMILNIEPTNIEAIYMAVVYMPLRMASLNERLKEPGLDPSERDNVRHSLELIYRDLVAKCRYLIDQQPAEVSYWLALANSHYEYSQQVTDPAGKKALLANADTTYRQAVAKHPDSTRLVVAYEEFLRNSGQSGGGETMLRELIGKSTGKAKYDAMMSLSSMYIQQGRYKDAGDNLVQLLQEDKHNIQAGTMLANLLDRVGEYARASYLFGEVRKEEDSKYLLARHIEVLLKLGDTEQSAVLVDEMRKKYPDDTATVLILARQATQNAKYAEAVAYANQILEKEPQNTLAHILKCNALYYDDKLQEAIGSLAELRKLAPKDSNMGRALLAKVYWRLSYYDDAINELNMALQTDPSDIESRRILVDILQNRGRWDELDACYTNAIKLYPNQVDWYIKAGKTSFSRGVKSVQSGQKELASQQFDKALSLMRQAFQVGRQSGEGLSEALTSMMDILRQLGKYQDIVAMAEKSLQELPNNTDLLAYKIEATYRLAMINNQPEKKKEALAMLESVLESLADKPEQRDSFLSNVVNFGDPDGILLWCQAKLSQRPDWTAVHMVLAGTYNSKGQKDLELAELEKAMELAKGDSVLAVEKRLSVAYVQAGAYEKAAEVSRRILEKEPRNLGVVNNLAYILLELGQHEAEAVEMAQKAYDLGRNNPAVIDTYAVALMSQKDYVKAEQMMLRAIQEIQQAGGIVPAEFEYHLAQALQGLERVEEAKRRLETALKQMPDENEISPADKQWKDKLQALLDELQQH